MRAASCACRACAAPPAPTAPPLPRPPPAAPLDAGSTRRAAPHHAQHAAAPSPLLSRRGALAAAGAALALQPSHAARAVSLPTAASLFRAQPSSLLPTVDPAFASLVRASAWRARARRCFLRSWRAARQAQPCVPCHAHCATLLRSHTLICVMFSSSRPSRS
jgi:hypothetical protein